MERHRRRVIARPLLSLASAAAVASLAACGAHGAPVSSIVEDDGGSTTPAARSPAASPPGAIAPRVTPDGRPACGNVASRAPRPPECEGR